MNNRSVTSRNFWGAFWGGFLGIALCGLISPMLLPFGCLGGVILGFWYDQIAVMIARSWRHSLIQTKRQRRRFISRATLIVRGAGAVLVAIASGLLCTVLFIGKILYYLAYGLWWVIKAPYVLARYEFNWWRAHPVNRANSVRAMAAATYCGIQLVWILPLGYYVLSCMAIKDHPGQLHLFSLMACFAIATLAVAEMFCDREHPNELSEMRSFYRVWAYYAERGGLRFFGYCLSRLLFVEALVAAYVVAAIAYMVVGIVLLLTFAIVPIGATVLAIRGIYEIARRPDHWLCFGVTLATTTIAACIGYHYLNGSTLWLVALATGLISGVATEAVRNLTVASIERTPRLHRLVTEPVESFLLPSWQLFTRIGQQLTERFTPSSLPNLVRDTV